MQQFQLSGGNMYDDGDANPEKKNGEAVDRVLLHWRTLDDLANFTQDLQGCS